MADTACTQECVVAVNPNFLNRSEFRGADLPVENCDWTDAYSFAYELRRMFPGVNVSLPTEAEWEYACRADTTTDYWFGNKATTDTANFGQFVGRTVPVKSYSPNPWGLWQMHGNVYEWCLNPYYLYAGSSVNVAVNFEQVYQDEWGKEVDRARKGGAWNSHAKDGRSASRWFSDGSMGHWVSDNEGFRFIIRE